MTRPGSRESAAFRRTLKRALNWNVNAVYGDADVVTVVYPPPPDETDESVHAELVAECTHIYEAVHSRDCASDILRGVCDIEAAKIPFVWLCRREWLEDWTAGEIDHVALMERIYSTSLVTNGNKAVAHDGI